MQMNIIRPILKSLFLLAAVNVGSEACAQVAAPPCSASFDVLDGSGTLLASIPEDGPVLYVCASGFLLLDFISTSSPSSGSSINLSSWDLDGSILSGVSTQFQVGADTELSVSLTISDLDLCSDIASVVIKVLGQPGFEADVDQPTCFGMCDGSLSGSYLSDLPLEYQHTWFLQGNEVGSGNITSSLCAGSYNVVVTDNGGCTNIDLPMVMGTPPAIEVTIAPPGPVSMCPGDNPITLSASHLNTALPLQSVQWSWSVGLSVTDQLVTEFTPSTNNLNQVLDINIVDANGCGGSASIYLPSRSASLFGTVEIDGSPCNDCVLQCFKMGEAGAWSPYTGISSDATGLYELGMVPGLTNCILKVIPPAAQYPNLPAFYYPNTHNWINSAIIFTGCNEATEKNMSLVSPPAMNGSTSINGGVYYITTGKTEAEDPIPGVDVVVEKVPPGNGLTVVTTDSQGRFTFNFVSETLGDTVYNFYVDITGVPLIDNYFLSVGANDAVIDGIDFCLATDSTFIEPCSLVSLTEHTRQESARLKIFPNPADEAVRFLVSGAKVQDVRGH
jgi:hypothetical protein